MSNVTKLGNFIDDNMELTTKLFKGSEVLSSTKLEEVPYAPRSHKNEGTYLVKLSKEEANTGAYEMFIERLDDALYGRNHTVTVPTLQEFMNRKYDDGRKIGKQLAKDGCPSYMIDQFSAIEILEEKEVLLTISGASQFVIGVSAFSNNQWDSYSGSSCLDVTKDEGNQIHVLGLLTSPRFFVAFTHDNHEELSNVDSRPRIMETRVILFEDDNGNLHFNSKAYGQDNKAKVKLKKTLLESGLAKGLLNINIDEDYIYRDSSSPNGVDSDTDEYLSDMSKNGTDLRAKIFKNVFQPVEVGVRGAYDIELGQSLHLSKKSENEDVVTCPCCRPYVDGEVQRRTMVVADFHDYRNDNGGTLNGVEIDLVNNCPACDGERFVTIERHGRWHGDDYLVSDIPSTWGDRVVVTKFEDGVVSYEDGWYILDNQNTVKMMRTYGLYDEGTFHVAGKDFILIYDHNQENSEVFKECVDKVETKVNKLFF